MCFMAEKAVSCAGGKTLLEKYFYRDVTEMFIRENKCVYPQDFPTSHGQYHSIAGSYIA